MSGSKHLQEQVLNLSVCPCIGGFVPVLVQGKADATYDFPVSVQTTVYANDYPTFSCCNDSYRAFHTSEITGVEQHCSNDPSHLTLLVYSQFASYNDTSKEEREITLNGIFATM